MNLVQVSGSNLNYVYVILGISLLALAIAYALRAQVLAQGEGTAKMQEIAAAVQEGAAAYLARQFKTLSVFVAIVFDMLRSPPCGERNRQFVITRRVARDQEVDSRICRGCRRNFLLD